MTGLPPWDDLNIGVSVVIALPIPAPPFVFYGHVKVFEKRAKLGIFEPEERPQLLVLQRETGVGLHRLGLTGRLRNCSW